MRIMLLALAISGTLAFAEEIPLVCYYQGHAQGIILKRAAAHCPNPMPKSLVQKKWPVRKIAKKVVLPKPIKVKSVEKVK